MKLLAVQAISVAIVLGAADARAVPITAGIPNFKEAQYFALKEQDKFACLQIPSRIINLKQVNDDSCDCPDGSDEPGTAACSNGRFYCANRGHVGAYIPSSRVNDGICEAVCCDGSDEAPGICPNTCVHVANETRSRRAEGLKLLAEGAKIRQEYVRIGNLAIDSRARQLDRLHAELPELEKHAQETEAKKEAEEKVEEAQIQQQLDQRAQRLQGQLERMGYLTPHSAKELYAALEGRAGKVLAIVMGELKAKAGIREDEAESEQTVAGAGDGELGRSAAQEEQVEAPVLDDALEAVLTQAEDGLDVRLEAAESARQAAKDAAQKLKISKGQIKEIDAINLMDFGPDQALYFLRGRCVTKHVGHYTYELCGYNNAWQKEAGHADSSLGHPKRLEKHGVIGLDTTERPVYSFHFEDGDQCWNGPARSVRVDLRCGLEDEIDAVSEPSMCEYVMDFRTPAACIALPEDVNLDQTWDQQEAQEAIFEEEILRDEF